MCQRLAPEAVSAAPRGTTGRARERVRDRGRAKTEVRPRPPTRLSTLCASWLVRPAHSGQVRGLSRTVALHTTNSSGRSCILLLAVPAPVLVGRALLWAHAPRPHAHAHAPNTSIRHGAALAPHGRRAPQSAPTVDHTYHIRLGRARALARFTASTHHRSPHTGQPPKRPMVELQVVDAFDALVPLAIARARSMRPHAARARATAVGGLPLARSRRTHAHPHMTTAAYASLLLPDQTVTGDCRQLWSKARELSFSRRSYCAPGCCCCCCCCCRSLV